MRDRCRGTRHLDLVFKRHGSGDFSVDFLEVYVAFAQLPKVKKREILLSVGITPCSTSVVEKFDPESSALPPREGPQTQQEAAHPPEIEQLNHPATQ